MNLTKRYNMLLLILLVQSAIAHAGDSLSANGHINDSKSTTGAKDLGALFNRHLLGNTISDTEPELVWESNLDPGAIIRPSKVARSTKAASRIAWGKEAKEGMFPYVVYLDGGGYLCTGSVIAPKAILTAAHCVRDEAGWAKASDISIYAGSVVYDYTDTYYVKASWKKKTLIKIGGGTLKFILLDWIVCIF